MKYIQAGEEISNANYGTLRIVYHIYNAKEFFIDEAIIRLEARNLDLGDWPDNSVKYMRRRAKVSDFLIRTGPFRITCYGPDRPIYRQLLSLLDDEIDSVKKEYYERGHL